MAVATLTSTRAPAGPAPVVEAARPRSGSGPGPRSGRSCSRSRIVLGVWQIVVWLQLEAGVRRPVAVHRVRRAVPRPGTSCSARAWSPCSAARIGFVARDRSSAASSASRSRASSVLRAAIGSMITGLQTMPSVAWVPLAIILFHSGPGRDPVRRRARRGAVDRQRHHRRHRQRPADPAARRPRARRARLHRAAPRRDPGRAAVGRRRAEAGLGVRVAQPDGRRADRRASPATSASASCSTARASSSTSSACARR